jgi:carbon-monoxide dehydrogenase small subunit
MTIGFMLNGGAVKIRSDASARLIDILRDSFALLGAKCGCRIGRCGSCLVFFNGESAQACLIPAFRVHGGEVLTIEGFSQSAEYQDIVRGFAQAGLENCGFCDTGKIIAAEALLTRNPHPSQNEILAGFNGIRCCCTDPELLVAGVLAAVDIRQRRVYGRSH